MLEQGDLPGEVAREAPVGAQGLAVQVGRPVPGAQEGRTEVRADPAPLEVREDLVELRPPGQAVVPAQLVVSA